jgi:murein DD-endopeptidase MepM/ murein hydrolase activator NlpD
MPRWAWLAGSIALVFGAFLAWPDSDGPTSADKKYDKRITRHLTLPAVEAEATNTASDSVGTSDQATTELATGVPAKSQAAPQENPSPAPERDWRTVTVRPGDTLAALFSRHGLGPVTVHHVAHLDNRTARLRDLRPGEELKLALDDHGDLSALRFELNEAELVEVVAEEEGLDARVIERPIETRVVRTSGVIRDSLYVSAQKAGLSDPLIMKLARIFAWDIDFVYDIRAGDRFFLVYEELYREGEKLRDGNILAATFVNRGESLTAIRYDTGDGRAEYYTPEGRNMRKEFLRTPVDFRRISSRFNPNRMHPSLGYRRPHRGVDYAADSGTPIIATGNGRVKSAGRDGGYGNRIIIEHAGRYSTLYAHLSKYARGVRAGARVEQGQIIGYVGMTGTATGPHLHYEFRVDGTHKDPLKVDFPAAESLPESERTAFRQSARPLQAQLDAMRADAMLASKQQ